MFFKTNKGECGCCFTKNTINNYF